MTQYFVRTQRNDRKTHILEIGTPAIRLGIIYTDFLLSLGGRNITEEEIIDPSKSEIVGNVSLYKESNIISVRSKGKELAAISQYGDYHEDGVITHYRKMPRDILLSKPEYKHLENMGFTHAYTLGENSSLSQVFCFQKGEDFSAIINSKSREINSALKGLALALFRRIEDQKFIFEFMKK